MGYVLRNDNGNGPTGMTQGEGLPDSCRFHENTTDLSPDLRR
ncbi:hypothetical protein T02_5863 [Trichinella nativa]|uniref:Uncharacterized protein n=1 Tax=Trichinella nativa TaxID=6335 RepID=A0A0V1LQ44_9BILA|nr:hypothetical protein T02_5863 [Trichinella nativa]